MDGLPRPSNPPTLLEIDDDLRGRFLDPHRHVEVLAPLSIRHRRRGNPRGAFAFADRYCRLTHNRDAFGLLLRAEASEELGDADGCRADIEASFRADPTLPGAARRLLSITQGAKIDVARLILGNPRADREAKLDAIEAVLAQGYGLISDLRYDGHDIQGLLAWEGTEWIEFSFDAEPEARWSRVTRETCHLRGPRKISVAHLPPWRVRLADDAGAMMHSLLVRSDRGILRRFEVNRFRIVQINSAPAKPLLATAPEGADTKVTVIVPVFGDRRMTQLCLIALLRQKREIPDLRVLIVDDNPDYSVLTPAMAQATARHGFEIVRNESNIGFARSINRALEMIHSGDVVLLNADVLLPPNAIGRLAQASRESPDIGTLTPFANNGEEASFPSAFHPAPLLPFRRICALDRIALEVNGLDAVTIVNGIGFCLYITRRALDIVGKLPEAYERGYYEDVDYSLAVRKAGLRNVCATGIYVGHKGSGSFQGAKRSLVARNRRILFSRYPSYVDESAALVAADPLRPARAAIERAIEPVEPVKSLLVLPACVVAKAAVYRREIGSSRCLCLTWPQDRRDKLIVWMADGSAPQSLHFEGANALEAMHGYLRKVGVEKAFVVGVAFERGQLIQQLRLDGIDIEILFDDSLLQITSRRDGTGCAVLTADEPCETCLDAFAKAPVRGRAGASSSLDAALKAARHVRPMNAMAAAVSKHFRLQTGETGQSASGAIAVVKPCAAATLGVLAQNGDVAVERLLHSIARYSLRPNTKMVVFGRSLDATRLMSSPGVFVTGEVVEEELDRLLASYEVDLLLAPSRWCGYGELERHAGDRPSAFFDWSGGLLRKHPRNLVLDPRACDRKIAHQLAEWWRGSSSSDDW